ncbi:restriction endonuclease [Ralstonia soli]|uniref:Restriction endonuclease n=1 Tax=Ralstonia soli TaxID=2953896 RepID=A0ABT1AED5_9RALS|nr:restriction endonuclease [Ralstonia soli]MCO5396582.1 restriction endonuclease [Ralstonia soli]
MPTESVAPNQQTLLSERVPVARAVATNVNRATAAEIKALAEPYNGATVGQRFFGPAWLREDGVPCLVFIAQNRAAVQQLRDQRTCVAIGWLWNNSPTMAFSFTLMLEGKNPRPHTRWIRPSTDPVVAAIRRHGRFYMIAVTPEGHQSTWFEAQMYSGIKDTEPSLDAMEGSWAHPAPGLKGSRAGQRFDPFACEKQSDTTDDVPAIPLWSEPASDSWAELNYDGPWAADLHSADKARAAWGSQVYRNRRLAAGFVRGIVERQTHDGVPPVVTEEGQWLGDGAIAEQGRELVACAPLIGLWLAALTGPTPCAESAHRACVDVLHDSYALFCVLDKLIPLLNDAGDQLLAEATRWTFEAALLDDKITQGGTHRPWFANTGQYGLELRSAPFNLDAPLPDIEVMWRSGLEILDLIDAGQRLGPNDFPVPLADVCEAMRSVALDGTEDEAEATIQAILREAQEARQWSIPWGARVEVAFGPFVAVRIFENQGEFSCHFLDAVQRYLHVVIGIASDPPRATGGRLIRPRDDDGEVTWNTDAELSLQLIAAAIVRDFLVVEEREALFGTRTTTRRSRGRDVTTVVYLPRVRYSRPNLRHAAQLAQGSGRAPHAVTQHLRRAATTSATQRFLAQRYGMHLPEGFTFVRPHTRGAMAEVERVRVYRSRSASRMIYEEVSTAPDGARPEWFEFERDCMQLLTDRGLRVIHQAASRDGDGGVDLYAVDESGQSWIVQCKCWAAHRSVGPETVRELHGAIAFADRGGSATSKGIVITTSRFTSGVAEVGREFGFELIDGQQFAEWRQKLR